MPHRNAPDALLFVTSQCPHCPAMIDHLGQLLKKGAIGRLQMINAESHPDQAEANGVRSVPWLRLGPYELHGNLPQDELADWVRRVREGQGTAAYLAHLLETNRLQRVLDSVHQRPNELRDLITLLDNSDTPFSVRIGVGAVIEEFADTDALRSIVPELGALTRSDDAQRRADACHYLGLSGSPEAIDHIRPLLDDEDESVREIATESLALLHADQPQAQP